MPSYLVSWVIDMDDVDNPEEAAARSLITMRDPESLATVFLVQDKDTGKSVQVDLYAEAVQ